MPVELSDPKVVRLKTLDLYNPGSVYSVVMEPCEVR